MGRIPLWGKPKITGDIRPSRRQKKCERKSAKAENQASPKGSRWGSNKNGRLKNREHEKGKGKDRPPVKGISSKSSKRRPCKKANSRIFCGYKCGVAVRAQTKKIIAH